MIDRKQRLAVALCLGSLLLFTTGCSTFAPTHRGAESLTIPESYTLYDNRPRPLTPWWETFENPELSGLMDEALSENLTLKEAWARLRQSTAQLKAAEAALIPSVNLEASGETTNREGDQESSSDTVNLGLAASYEIDLWGRIRALKKAQDMRLSARRADVETAAITLSGQVAEAWTDLVATRSEIALLKEQIQLNKTLLKALELRFENSLVSVVDVLRQRKAIGQLAAELPPLLEEESRYQNSLALLLGRLPGEAPQVTTTNLPLPQRLPTSGLPADLLAMRPDIRSAGLSLKAEEWEISAARADRLPSLSITARARYTGDGFESLFDNWLTNLAANLTGPIFDAGRRKAEVKRARAEAEEQLATYKKTVLTAMGEVENALTAEMRQRQRVSAMEDVLETSKQTLAESENRYTRGATDYVTLLGELRDLQTLERSIVQQKANLMKRRITLCRTLGGSWTQELADPANTESNTTRE